MTDNYFVMYRISHTDIPIAVFFKGYELMTHRNKDDKYLYFNSIFKV